MSLVTHYGIHFGENKVGWLEQGRGGTNAIGRKDRSPFTVRLSSGRRHCNHQIGLAPPIPNDRHWDMFMALQDDALVRAMMPFPKPDAGIFFIKESPKLVDYAVMLSRMSSPINPTVMPVWSFTDPRELLEILGETNVQPLVLHGAADKDIELLRKIAQPASIKPRKLIVAGSADLVPPSVYRRIETELTTDKYSFNELNVLPWESLGATAIRKWMRKEWVSEVRCTRTQGDTRDE